MNRFIVLSLALPQQPVCKSVLVRGMLACLLFCMTVPVRAQVHQEDYLKPPESSVKYIEETAFPTYADESTGGGTFIVYSTDIDDLESPVSIFVNNPRSVSGTSRPFSFQSIGSGGASCRLKTFLQLQAATGKTSYNSVYNRIVNGSHGMALTVEYAGEYSVANLFEGINSLEWVSIKCVTSPQPPYHMSNDEGLFRDCVNLKYVEFDIDHGSMNQDIFLGCRSLEVINFKRMPPDPNNMLKIFNTNHDNTGWWNYPNLKAIVVPDNYKDQWGSRDFDKEFADKICKKVAEGTCKIITASEFNGKKVKGISFAGTSATLTVGDEYQLQPVFSPADAWNKNVTYSSSDNSIANVTPTGGLISAIGAGTAYITATAEEFGFTAVFTVTVTQGSGTQRLLRKVLNETTLLDYDRYTGIATIKRLNLQGSTEVNASGGSLDKLVGSNSLRGVIVDEGITSVTFWVIVDLDFVYLPATCSSFSITPASKIKWFYIMSRSGDIDACATPGPGTIENCVFNGLFIIDEPYTYPGGGTPAGGGADWVNTVKNMYCTDRAADMFKNYMPEANKVTFHNLADIPYQEMFEDIKYKDATWDGDFPVYGSRPALSGGYSASVSKVNKTGLYEYATHHAEIDFIAGIAYIHAKPDVKKLTLDFAEAQSQMPLVNDHCRTVIFAGGEEIASTGNFLQHDKLDLAYVSKSFHNIYCLSNRPIKTVIFAGPRVSINEACEGKHWDNAVFQGNTINPFGLEWKGPDTKTYAKTNLTYDFVRYTLDAFDMLPVIKAFNTVSNFSSIQPGDMADNLQLTRRITVTGSTVTAVTKDTVSFSVTPANVPYTVKSFNLVCGNEDPASLADIRQLSKTRFEITPKKAFSNATFNVTVQLSGGEEKSLSIPVSPVLETITGDITAITLHDDVSAGKDLLSKDNTPAHIDGTYRLVVRYQPRECALRSVTWHCVPETDFDIREQLNDTVFRFNFKNPGIYKIECFVNSYLNDYVYFAVEKNAAVEDTTLTSLSSGFGLTPAFASDIRDYTVAVSPTANSVSVNYIKASPASKVSLQPDKDAPEFISGSTVAVTDFPLSLYIFPNYLSKDYGTYRLNISILDNNAALANSSLLRFTHIARNTADVYQSPEDLDITVENDVIHAQTHFTPMSPKSQVSGNADMDLQVGDNYIPVTVKAEDKTERVYNFNIRRKPFEYDVQFMLDYETADGVLKSIEVPVVNSMDIPVPRERIIDKLFRVQSSYCEVLLNGTKHTVSSFEDIRITSENNELSVSNGYDSEVFNCTVSLRPDIEPLLDNLFISGHTLTPAFNPDIKSYTLSVGKTVDSIEVSAASVPGITLSGDTGKRKLLEGRNVLQVSAHSIFENTLYKIEVTKERKNTDAHLKSLSVYAPNSVSINPPFDPDLFSYSAEVSEKAGTAFIVAETISEFATFDYHYRQPGTYSLNYGNNEFKFIVEAENKAYSLLYTLNIMRREQTTGLKSFEDTPSVNVTDNAIEVYSEAEEWIRIYTVSGDLVLIDKKPKGAWKFPVPPVYKTVLIIKAASGWVRKITI